jgi:hypothetical protein
MSAAPQVQKWRRLVAEGLLIVLSILLAFGIEAGWSQRGDRQHEVDALHGLRDDFVENLAQLSSARSEHTAVRDAAVRLLPMTGPAANQSAPNLVMDTLVMALIAAPKVLLVTATYDALIASGRIQLLQSAGLRRELARWATTVADLREEERDAFRQMDQRLLPFLWDFVPIVTLDVNVLPRYQGSDLNESAFSPRYQDLLRSLRFENAVEERMNSSLRTLDRVTEAERTVERVLALVESELAAL